MGPLSCGHVFFVCGVRWLRYKRIILVFRYAVPNNVGQSWKRRLLCCKLSFLGSRLFFSGVPYKRCGEWKIDFSFLVSNGFNSVPAGNPT